MAAVPILRVALLAEGVDRNDNPGFPQRLDVVALLAEGVDRNGAEVQLSLADRDVALLAEGVDRNGLGKRLPCKRQLSPSSRRAWIEILRKQG